MPYSLDTSYLLDAWAVWYPFEIFDGYWEVLLGAAKAGEVLVVDVVRDELERQVPRLVEVFDEAAPQWSRATQKDATLRTGLNELERNLAEQSMGTRYPPQNLKKYMACADPVLILHARRHGHVVVSKELSDLRCKKGPKIPDLCNHLGVMHAAPNEFAGILGYTFTRRAAASAK